MHLNKRALQLFNTPHAPPRCRPVEIKKVQQPFGVAEKFIGSLENTTPEPPPALCRRLDPFPAVYCDKLNTRQREGCPAPAARHIVFPLLRLACQPAEQSTGELTLATATLFYFFISLSCEFECNSRCDEAAGGKIA